MTPAGWILIAIGVAASTGVGGYALRGKQARAEVAAAQAGADTVEAAAGLVGAAQGLQRLDADLTASLASSGRLDAACGPDAGLCRQTLAVCQASMSSATELTVPCEAMTNALLSKSVWQFCEGQPDDATVTRCYAWHGQRK